MKPENKEKIEDALYEAVSVSRWTENEEALYVVLKPEEIEQSVKDIFTNLDKAGYEISRKYVKLPVYGYCKKISAFFIAILFIGGTAYAEDNQTGSSQTGTSLGANIGTLGYGLELGERVSDSFGFRLAANQFNYKYNGSIKGVPYKLKLGLATAGIVADYYPFQGDFRLVGGFRIDGNALKETASGSLVINGNTYNTGQLSGKVTYDNHIAPYLGIGYVARLFSGFELSTDLGALYQGNARVSLNSPNNSISAADISTEMNNIKKYAQDLQFYPVLGITLAYHF